MVYGNQSFHSTRCNIPMNECVRSDVKDGMGWKCPSCKTRTSLRQGSFFSESHLTLQKWVMIIHFWSKQNPVGDTAESAEIGKNTAVDVYQWLREVCSTRLIQDGPVVLGGPGIVVQIDESLFKHKPKVQIKHVAMKYCILATEYCVSNCCVRGRHADYEQWVFGMVDTSHQPALGYMQMVDTRDAATLLPLIRAHAAPGTIIHSDEWASYS